MNIVCTQTNLPRGEQARLIKQWCEVLPTLERLEFLWFSSKVSQELFDAACRVPHLQGLWMKWSSIKSLDALAEATALRFFHLGSSSQVTSVEPLRGLQNLIWLELENIKLLHELSAIGELQQLQGLAVEGSMWTTHVVDSLAPLANLRALRYLALANLKARDNTLIPLFALSSLETLYLARWWKEAELNQLKAANPRL